MSFFNHHSPEVLTLFFLIITFFLSSIDKITDWKGNVDFITNHFKNSPLQSMVPLLLGTLLVLEIIASFLMIYGVYDIITNNTKLIALIGAEISAISLLFMLIGQRLAKDYTGAMTIAVYFIVNIFALILLQ